VGDADEIGVGIVGYGLAGRSFHAPFIVAAGGLALKAVATANPERRRCAADEHPAAAVVGTPEELIDHPDVGVVVVAAPNRFHVPIAIRALAAGRHTVVDKPIAMDVAEAETLLEAADRANRVLTVYQNRRWDGDFLTARRLIDEGVLGQVDSLEARFERWSRVGPEWREIAAEGGGPLPDLGAHLIDQSLILFGSARSVWAQADRRRPDSQVDDSVFVAIDHVNGVRSRLWVSLTASRVGPRMRIRGAVAEYVKEDLDPQEAQLLDGMRPDDPVFGVEPSERWGRLFLADGSMTSVQTERGSYLRFYEQLREAIHGRGAPPVNPLDSVRVLRVLAAADRAAKTGQAQTMSGW
jgi:predicted dehydrogenase